MDKNNKQHFLHNSFEESADHWRQRNAEMGPRPVSKMLIALGGIAITTLGIQGTRNILNEPSPNYIANTAPVYREFTPTPDIDPAQAPCTVVSYRIDTEGESRWSVAELYAKEFHSNESIMDILSRTRDVSGDPTIQQMNDIVNVYSDDNCIPKE